MKLKVICLGVSMLFCSTAFSQNGVSEKAQKLDENARESGREFGDDVSSNYRRDHENRPERSYQRAERRQNIRDRLPQQARDRASEHIGSGRSNSSRRGR